MKNGKFRFIAANINPFGKLLFFGVVLCLLQSSSAFSATWYVAANGADSNSGTIDLPFATITRAQSAASFGDTVYLRGGTYFLDNSDLTTTNNPWAIVNNINKNGIRYVAYPGERPVFDFSNVKPDSYRVTAFLVTASQCVFEGFDVVGVQVTIAGTHTQSENFRVASVGAGFNLFENLRMHDGMGNGWYLTDGYSNVVLNCDAYNNRGLDSGSLGNTDGFGCHPAHTSGKGNILMGCRAWFNSDDGYDCINSFAVVTFSNCWAFYNGYFTNFVNSTGDGNGIKGGGYGVSGGSFPTPIPHHVIEHCLSVRNRASGFYANHHLDGQIWLNNTAYHNGTDYNMLCSTNNSSNAGDVPGFDQVMKNNLGFEGGTEVANLNQAASDVSFNFFTLPVTVTSSDFVTLDENSLPAPRQANGDLPWIAFAQLAEASDLVDAGTNVGFAYAGAAPDLGVFERGLHAPPALEIALAGTNLAFNVFGTWAVGTNYLIAATNVADPLPTWTTIAAAVSDLTGHCAFTNGLPGDPSQRFYRIRLP